MTKLSKAIKQIRKTLVISLGFMILFVANASGQNTNTSISSEDNGLYQSQKGFQTQIFEVQVISHKTKDILPGMGSEFNEIAKTISRLIVIDDQTSNIDTIYNDSNSPLGFALTSAYINDQLLDGMRLEFHANPVEGGGAVLFKKFF